MTSSKYYSIQHQTCKAIYLHISLGMIAVLSNAHTTHFIQGILATTGINTLLYSHYRRPLHDKNSSQIHCNMHYICSLTGRSDVINPCAWSPTLCCEHRQCFLQVDIVIFCLHWLTCHNCNNTSKRSADQSFAESNIYLSLCSHPSFVLCVTSPSFYSQISHRGLKIDGL